MSEIFSQLSGRQGNDTNAAPISDAQLELGLPAVATSAPPRTHRTRQPAVMSAPVDESALKDAQAKLTDAQTALARNEELLASLRRELAAEGEVRQQAQAGSIALQKDIQTLKDQSLALAAEREQLQRSLAELRAKPQPPPNFMARQEELVRQQKDSEARIRKADAAVEKAHQALATEQRLRNEERQQAAAREQELNEQLLAARRSGSRIGTKSIAIAAIAVLAVVVGAFMFNRHQAKPSGASHAVADKTPVVASVPAASPALAKIEPAHSSIISNAETGSSHPPPAPAVASGAILPAIELKGLKAKPEGSGFQIVFDNGVFSRRAILSDEARILLKQLAGQLRPAISTCRLEITGHADPEPVRGDVIPDNQALAYQRARTVAEYLAKECSLPADALSATSAGDTNSPYPNTTPELRRKNRTVTISVTPR